MQDLHDMTAELYGCSSHVKLLDILLDLDENCDRPSPALIADDLMGLSEELEWLADTADKWWLEIERMKERIKELEAEKVGQ